VAITNKSEIRNNKAEIQISKRRKNIGQGPTSVSSTGCEARIVKQKSLFGWRGADGKRFPGDRSEEIPQRDPAQRNIFGDRFHELKRKKKGKLQGIEFGSRQDTKPQRFFRILVMNIFCWLCG
jgi:hypothetical protein